MWGVARGGVWGCEMNIKDVKTCDSSQSRVLHDEHGCIFPFTCHGYTFMYVVIVTPPRPTTMATTALPTMSTTLVSNTEGKWAGSGDVWVWSLRGGK